MENRVAGIFNKGDDWMKMITVVSIENIHANYMELREGGR